MYEIFHRVTYNVPPDTLYNAITSSEGLSNWWTTKVDTDSKSYAHFSFGDGSHVVKMNVTQMEPNSLLRWQCAQGPWQGHNFQFAIEPHDKGCVLNFSHQGWEEQSEFYGHCNSKWGFFIGVSLKDFVEHNNGRPHPEEPDI